MDSRELSFSLGIGVAPSTEVEDSDVASELFMLYRALNLLASQVDVATGGLAAPAGDRYAILPSTSNKEGNISRLYGYATVALTAGELVTYNSAGQLVKAQSNVTHNLKAQAVVLENAAAGAYASLAARGVFRLYVGLTPGAYYYLGTTAGSVSITPPAGGSGNTVQYIGYAISASELYINPELRHTIA